MRQGITALECQGWDAATGVPRPKKCPRQPGATITTLTAATCGVLTGFVGFRPTDLGHTSKLLGAPSEVNGTSAGRTDRAWIGMGSVCGIYYGNASAANATPAVTAGIVARQN